MPIYEYRCRNGHTFEVFQSISDDPVTSCEKCGAQVERVLHPVAVHFKGSGFYTTDYAKKKAAASGESQDDGAKKDSGPGDPSKSESKPAEKSGKAEKSTSD